MGFWVLYVSINLFKLYYGDDWEGLYESITGYGLGGSSMALFGRVGGGIYTKAADVGADLVALFVRQFHNLVSSMTTQPCLSIDYKCNGIVVCLITTLFATDLFEIKNVSEIEPSLKRQLVISTILMTAGIAMVSFLALPSEFTLYDFGTDKLVKNWHLFFCVSIGLWAGLVIDLQPSTILAMLTGMLSTISTGLAIDAYGPISDKLEIAEMAGMSHKIRERTDALDAAGNTTAAIGKGFAIGSAALVSLALFGAFVSRAGIKAVDVLTQRSSLA
ncbi:hypothetical protein GH714_006142 [Hevea brasiliensis]|uniref:H(+)-exporting diphosphatase n=1 Tax=Hevea brasiliensis TaxID=3981 RepID=A0A6A6NFV0_HEVBR|nr:hypothetical protein GH714_006142 [Hevea brasiliensis]